MPKHLGKIKPSLWEPTQQALDWQARHGLLAVEDDTFYFKCVRSGGCCQTNLCAVGEYDASGKQCRHLVKHAKLESGHQLYSCSQANEEDTKAACQIDKGCCMPWSSQRNAILGAVQSDPTNLIAILTPR